MGKGYTAFCRLNQGEWLPVFTVLGPPYAGVLRPQGEMYFMEVKNCLSIPTSHNAHTAVLHR